MFSFIKQKILHRFIIVEIQDLLASVHIYDVKNKNLLAQVSEDFKLESKDSFTDEMNSYINQKQADLTHSYVVTILNSQGQGIIPTCSTSEFKNYSIDRRYIYNICVDQKFTNFVSKIEINWLQKLFSKTGIDLIFSPFVILKDLVDLEEKSSEVLLYILYYNQCATIMIKKDDRFIFGDFFNALTDENPLYCDFEDSDGEEDEDEFEIEDEFDFDEDDNMDFDDSDSEETVVKEVELIEENRGFAKHLSSSLKEFYSDEKYESSFIDSVKIFSSSKIDSSIVEYIEEELLLNTKVEYIDMDEKIVQLCQKEVIGV